MLLYRKMKWKKRNNNGKHLIFVFNSPLIYWSTLNKVLYLQWRWWTDNYWLILLNYTRDLLLAIQRRFRVFVKKKGFSVWYSEDIQMYKVCTLMEKENGSLTIGGEDLTHHDETYLFSYKEINRDYNSDCIIFTYNTNLYLKIYEKY